MDDPCSRERFIDVDAGNAAARGARVRRCRLSFLFLTYTGQHSYSGNWIPQPSPRFTARDITRSCLPWKLPAIPCACREGVLTCVLASMLIACSPGLCC